MKRILPVLIAVAALASCGSKQTMVIPKAISSMERATFEDLNLQKGDYDLLNTVSAEALITYEANRWGNHIVIKGVDDGFVLDYTLDSKKGWLCRFSGILKFGYLEHAFAGTRPDVEDPGEIANRLAIYRLISQVKMAGGDGIIAPSVQTNVQQQGDVIYLKASATAKAIRLKPTVSTARVETAPMLNSPTLPTVKDETPAATPKKKKRK